MALDEALFGAAFRAWTRMRGGPGVPPEHLAAAVKLDSVKHRVGVVCSALLEQHVTVQAAEDVGGLAGRVLLLPQQVAIDANVEVNRAVYLWRAVHAALLHTVDVPRELGPTHAMVCAMPALLERARATMPRALEWFDAAALALRATVTVERRTSPWELLGLLVMGCPARDLAPAHPDALAWAVATHAQLPSSPRPVLPVPVLPRGGWLEAPPALLWGRLLPPRAEPQKKKDLPDATGSSGTQREGKPREQVTRMELRDEPEQESPLVHSFEKVHTLEPYQGGSKRVDGDDEMEHHANALEDVDLRKVVQSNKATRSVYRADVLLDVVRDDVDLAVEAGGLPYDEWDHTRGSYRPQWCRLHQSVGTCSPPGQARQWAGDVIHRHRRSVDELSQTFSRLRSLRRWRGRQVDGPDVDVDAMVDRHASLCARVTPDHRVFSNRLRNTRSVAVMLLLDGSLSTDSYVEGLRVLDVARDSILVFGEAVKELDIPVAVAAFHSNTRRDCRYVGLKGFDEPWSMAHQRLLPLVPQGYTRMGPALRHATRVLVQQPAHRRLLVLLSDGKPTDHDAYEGRHGIEDVRQAVREADASGVHVFALAVDARARHHLPNLFGPLNFRVLPHPGHLPQGLAAVHARLLR